MQSVQWCDASSWLVVYTLNAHQRWWLGRTGYSCWLQQAAYGAAVEAF